ncbi:hypothetical protein ACPCHT_09675 [Nucisporomicrobium flavum]|uniref:hypothetical protein n=1 Tax=Nucisporomicrobium flavum TaxID=2785915 RepID=UPI0018F43CF2|nr:hypothetical protein [Nucisporomicrobium flavum]
MAEKSGRAGPGWTPAKRPTIAQIVDISVRTVGDSAATSDDGNWDAAEATLTSAFTAAPEQPDRRQQPTGQDRADLFADHCAAGRWGDAAAVAGELEAYHRRYYGRYHHRTVLWTGRLGEAYLRDGDPGRAEPLLLAALTALESLRGAGHPETLNCRRLYDAARAGRPGPTPAGSAS